jgi:hypothetical protein
VSTYYDEDREHSREANHEDSSPAEKWEDAECDENTDDETSVDAHVEVERLDLIEAGGLKEHDSV